MGKRSTAEDLTRVAMTLEDNGNSLCGCVHAITSLINNVKLFLVLPQEDIDLEFNSSSKEEHSLLSKLYPF